MSGVKNPTPMNIYDFDIIDNTYIPLKNGRVRFILRDGQYLEAAIREDGDVIIRLSGLGTDTQLSILPDVSNQIRIRGIRP
jgi:hypothetical protein